MRASDLLYLGQQLTKAGQLALRSVQPEMQTAESMVVAHLAERRFSTVTEIAQHTGYVQSRISNAVTALKERGVVQSRVDAADRRRSVIYLTEQPIEEVDDSLSADPVLHELLSAAGEEEREGILSALERLVVLLREPEPEGRKEAADHVLDGWVRELGIPRERLEELSPRELAALFDARGKSSSRRS